MNRRLILIAAFALALAAGAASLLVRPAPPPPQGAVALGGPFALVDQDGRRFTDRDLRGRPAAIFFGFTFCPEVCPTTLARHTAALKALGADADRLRVVFVTVDPERDTPAAMKRYLSDFDGRITGLTGAPAAVGAMLASYHAYARKVALEGGGYTMDHVSATYLFDGRGGFRGLIPYTADVPAETAQLKALIG